VTSLRGFQVNVKNAVYAEWAAGHRVVMPVLPTGSGKTVILANIAAEYSGFGCAIAHRSELVGQISIALSREGVRHDIVAPKATIRTIVKAQMDDCGRSFYDPRAKWKVASVDTIIRRVMDEQWMRGVGMVIQDEGHHVLQENKWGRAMLMFPNAYGLLPTATPERADGRGLGRHADGLVDAMVEGPDMRWLINNGYLTDYEVRAPSPRDLDMNGVDISAATGDYNVDQMRTRVKASTTIIGDVVATYQRHAVGKKGITFAVDVEHATRIAAAFNAAGVPAEVVHADTPDADRINFMQKFKRGELMQLVNVDLFGEGVDVPAIEVVSMARPTASYGLYVQQFGRALRLLISPVLAGAWDTFDVAQRLRYIAESTKPKALILDHVGNIVTHGGPPDWRAHPWSLDRRAKRTRATDGIPLRACANEMCLMPFERIYPACPYCGWVPPVPAKPAGPHEVDGDVVLYTPEMLEELFGRKARLEGNAPIPVGMTDPKIIGAIRKAHAASQHAQLELRQVMEIVMPPTLDARVAQRKFYHTFGVDTLTAQGLRCAEATELRDRIIQRIQR